jgi:hypothetical protein
MAVDNEAVSLASDALSRSDIAAAISACKSDRGSLFDEPGLHREVEFILIRTPQILADCPKHILGPLRIATALMILWGVSTIRRFIAVEGHYTYRYSAEAVAHSLSSHAAYLCRLAQIRETGLRNVQILRADLPEDCAVCRHTSERHFTVDDVPELPLIDCTCPDYCKCVLIAVA